MYICNFFSHVCPKYGFKIQCSIYKLAWTRDTFKSNLKIHNLKISNLKILYQTKDFLEPSFQYNCNHIIKPPTKNTFHWPHRETKCKGVQLFVR